MLALVYHGRSITPLAPATKGNSRIRPNHCLEAMGKIVACAAKLGEVLDMVRHMALVPRGKDRFQVRIIFI